MFLPAALFASALLIQQVPPASDARAPVQTPAPASASGQMTVAQETTLPTVNVEAQQASPTQTCRTEAVTGSRFGRRVCRNNVQSEDDRINSREMLRRLQGARMPDGG